MKRIHSDWLKAYQEYVAETEGADIHNKWVGISVISSVLRKKARFELGRLNIYPNIFTVLVGSPGVRKSVSINFGLEFLKALPDIVVSSDAITPEAFIQDLEAAGVVTQLPDNDNFAHSSMSIISKELEVFLGNKLTNMKMITMLTDFWDAPETDWSYRIKHGRSNAIPSIYVNMLAATTPASLATSLPPSSVGAGFTSRIMFIYASKREHKVPIPEITPKLQKLKQSLLTDLNEISQIAGAYRFTEEGKEFWIDWYNNHDTESDENICTDPAFEYWYERKATHIIKLATILAASESSKLEITPKHLKTSIKTIKQVEREMDKSFSSMGKAVLNNEVEKVLSILRQHGTVTEVFLFRQLMKDVDALQFKTLIESLLKSEKITLIMPNGSAPIRYKLNQNEVS